MRKMTDEELISSGTATLMPDEFNNIVKELVWSRSMIGRAERMCQAIFDGYPDPNIGHKDYRVQVAHWAEDFLRATQDNPPNPNQIPNINERGRE